MIEEVNLISIITWSIAASILLVFIVISLFTYRTNHDKTLKYYALYCSLILVYLLYKFDFYEPYALWVSSWGNHGFNWMIQLVYHAFYIAFGINFLELPKYYPALYRFTNKYFRVILIVGILGMCLSFFPFKDYSPFTFFFVYIFLPPHLFLAIFIAVKSWSTDAPARYYFTIGSLIYMILSMYALYTSLKFVQNIIPEMDAIAYFYVAIVFECLIFSYGLSQRIRLLHNQKMAVQKELEIAQQKIHEKLEEEISLKQKENLILLEQKQKQELLTRVASLQQKVLRSQINSHFIFNVLNSIKLFILENDSQKASLYLGKFARFIRAVLDSSVDDQSNLAEELETIELYLSIEQMRFNDKFTYDFDIQEDINLNSYPFPPLLLQPFVENALWHGLMQIEKNALLIVRIRGNKDELKIEIDDNGIGYRQSIANKKNGHKSLGLKIAKERIDHYNLQQKFHLDYTLLDKSDTGNGTGTIARIILKKIGMN